MDYKTEETEDMKQGGEESPLPAAAGSTGHREIEGEKVVWVKERLNAIVWEYGPADMTLAKAEEVSLHLLQTFIHQCK